MCLRAAPIRIQLLSLGKLEITKNRKHKTHKNVFLRACTLFLFLKCFLRFLSYLGLVLGIDWDNVASQKELKFSKHA